MGVRCERPPAFRPSRFALTVGNLSPLKRGQSWFCHFRWVPAPSAPPQLRRGCPERSDRAGRLTGLAVPVDKRTVPPQTRRDRLERVSGEAAMGERQGGVIDTPLPYRSTTPPPLLSRRGAGTSLCRRTPPFQVWPQTQIVPASRAGPLSASPAWGRRPSPPPSGGLSRQRLGGCAARADPLRPFGPPPRGGGVIRPAENLTALPLQGGQAFRP